MANVIYSIYIEIEKENYDQNIGSYYYDEKTGVSKSRRSHYEYEKYKKELALCKEIYSDVIGCDFILFGNDKDYKNFSKKMLSECPHLSKYEIINFYKFDRAVHCAKTYDNVLFLDFDVIPNNFHNWFDYFDPSKFHVQDSPIRVSLPKDVLSGRWQLDARAPEAKMYNAGKLLEMYNLDTDDNKPWNTAIMGFTSEMMDKLDYFKDFTLTMEAMYLLKQQNLPKPYKRLLGYDNETLFGFRIIQHKIPYQILPVKWHYLVDDLSIKKVHDNICFCHCIDKQFGRFFGY